MRSAVSSPFLRSVWMARSKRIERDLPHHRVDHVLDLAGEQRLALLGAFGLRQQPLEGQHLAEHAGGLRQRQRRRRHQRAVLRRQHLMHAVAELMGERHHVARLALIVHQHIGMRRRRGRMRERARRLAGPHRRIDPAIGEEPLGDAGHLRREAAIGRQHHVLAPRGQAMLPVAANGSGALRSQCGELLLFEPAGLEPVIAVRQLRIGRANRTHQRIDHLALDAVVQMARIRDVLEAAPAIGNLLVLGERIGDERKGPLIGLEGLRQRLRRRLALCAARSCSRLSVGSIASSLAGDLEAQAGDGLVEQPVPGGIAALGFLVEQLLDAVLQLIRLVLAQILDPRPIMRQSAASASRARSRHRRSRLSSSAKNSRCTEALVSRSETSP